MPSISIKSKNSNKHRNTKTDPFYNSKEYKSWRIKVIAKSNGLCVHCLNPGIKNKSGSYGKAIKSGYVTDHIIPIQAGGSKTDINNGQYLCEYHHSVKSIEDKKYYL